MKVSKPPGSANYDADYLAYCCLELKHNVIGDGGAIVLIDKGLCLRTNNRAIDQRRVKFCPECGQQITHEDFGNVEVDPPVADTKQILRDKPKSK